MQSSSHPHTPELRGLLSWFPEGGWCRWAVAGQLRVAKVIESLAPAPELCIGRKALQKSFDWSAARLRWVFISRLQTAKKNRPRQAEPRNSSESGCAWMESPRTTYGLIVP